ncbi:MAG: FHA domain-containing protein [Planctomycetaceae bacterium]|nr:FHA domain-containing protein [Planctomycetaceae bacterium]
MLQASLKVIGGKNDGKLIQFQTNKFLVGREQDCHLRPNSDLVSRHHCVFTVDDYALRLRDLGSTNGTLVNGRRIRGETLLTSGDVVRIGKLNLEVVIGNQVPSASTGTPSTANEETTTNASAMETSHEVPQPTTLEDSGSMPASASSDTIYFEVGALPPEELGADGQELTESETTVSDASYQETVVDSPTPQPVSADATSPPPQPGEYLPPVDPQQYPQQQYPQGAWQYPQYPQYMQQYPQYPPPGYPMGYPPPGYPGYGYPGQYPGNYPQQGQGVPQPEQTPAQEPPGSSAEVEIPGVRLPNPEDTGVKDEPKPPASEQQEAPKPQSNERTPSKSAADLINASRRRRRAGE